MKRRNERIAEIRRLATKQQPLTLIENEFVIRNSYVDGIIVVRNPDSEQMKLIKSVTSKGYQVHIIYRTVISNSIEYQQFTKSKQYGNAT